MHFDGTGTVSLRVRAAGIGHPGGSTSPLTSVGVFRLETWVEDAIQPVAEPVRPARWEDVDDLLRSHFERLDSVYRRLS